MKNKLWMGVAAAALAWSAVSQAEIFVGGGIGSADIDDTAHGLRLDDSATGWKIYGGMLVTENFGFEAGWSDLGDMNDGGVDMETEAFYAAGLVSLPVGGAFSIYGKLGVAFWDQDVNTVNYDGEGVMYGFGAKFRFMEQFHVRVEWERYDADFESDMIAVGAGLQF